MSGAAATLKSALTYNGITLAQLMAMSEVDARRLPWIGPKVWAEAMRQSLDRAGPGRPQLKRGEATVVVSLRLTQAQAAKYTLLGRHRWVRRMIDRARIKKMPTEPMLDVG